MKTKKSPRVAFVSEQCLRDFMEDVHTFDPNFIKKGWVFGGVYDAHRDARPAEVASERVPQIFRQHIRNLTPEEAFKKAYELTSNEMSTWSTDRGGTCAANFFIKNGVIYYANVGDVAIVVVGKKIVQLTTDHRVSNDDEQIRVHDAGGDIQGEYVWIGSDGLMPTRTLGDQRFKAVGITYEPAVGSYKIQTTDRFLIAGSDGLFDKVELGEIYDISQKRRSPQLLAKDLQDKVSSEHGHDNLTIIVLKL